LNPIKVLIVDDQHLFAESLKFVLGGESRGRIGVIGIAADGVAALESVEREVPDVVLLDIRMPRMDGMQTTEALHDRYPEMKIIILTTFDDDELAVAALSRGASGYVLKDVDPPDLIRCIEAVYNGAYFISPSVGIKLFEPGSADDRHGELEKESLVVGYLREIPSLSRREAEILYYVVRALSNKEIAEALFISEKTVKNHLSAVYFKLDVHNRLQLMNMVLQVSENIRHNPPLI